MATVKEEPVIYGDEVGAIDEPSWSQLTEEEYHSNAKYVLWFMMDKGWTYQSCIGLLGNMFQESRICPTNRERGEGGTFKTGCGLIQWTPWRRVQEFLENWGFTWQPILSNMEGQMTQVYYELDFSQSGSYVWHVPVYYEQQYVITKNQFKECTDIDIAAGAYVTMRERPGSMGANGSIEKARATVERRQRFAHNLHNWLRQFLNPDGTLTYTYGDAPVGTSSSKFIYYLRPLWWNAIRNGRR